MVIFITVMYGLILGSFFNVLIWRIPREESIFWPASHCPKCSVKIKPWHNIPVLSYLFLRGRCFSCSEKIPPVYPLVELCTGGAAVAVWMILIEPLMPLTWQQWPAVLIQSIFLLLMIPVTVIDFRHYIIPDLFTLPMLGIGLLVSFFPGFPTPTASFFGILGGGGTLYAIGWIGAVLFKKGEAMGGGDIKIMAAAGALWGAQTALMGILFGALLGSVFGITIMAIKKINTDHRIPFGPFLGAGIWIAVLYGKQILKMYLRYIDNAAGM